jgi:beta-glucosidase
LPDGFLWGASTAAYQIEGAVNEDGRGPSIWDKFSHTPGKIAGGDNGDVACDHYHRYREDIGLMRELGLGAYRFSIAWSRVMPEGRGQVNKRGLEFYDRLVDGIMGAGIEPWICLYHWDLPLALEDRGGWQNRDTAYRYADYALVAMRRLGDRVKHWATFNEPNVATFKGYGDGEHAPGIRGRRTALKALHMMNLAHGLGMQAMRAERADLKLGNIYNLHPTEPAEDRDEDHEAAIMLDAMWNRAFPDPQILGRYPEPFASEVEDFIEPGDMDIIRQRLDYFAFNHYTRLRVRHDKDHPFHVAEVPPPDGRPVTDMGWEVAPSAFRDQMIAAKKRWSGDLPMYITENGAAFADTVEANGRIRDRQRSEYLRDYLLAIGEAIAAGVPVKGYFVWSLLDNFEWALGFSKRFGLVHVDYETMKRTPKDSFRFYAELAHGASFEDAARRAEIA